MTSTLGKWLTGIAKRTNIDAPQQKDLVRLTLRGVMSVYRDGASVEAAIPVGSILYVTPGGAS